MVTGFLTLWILWVIMKLTLKTSTECLHSFIEPMITVFRFQLNNNGKDSAIMSDKFSHYKILVISRVCFH